MNTTNVKQNPYFTQLSVGSQAKDLVSFGQSRGWQFPVLGIAPMPERPVSTNSWLISPAHLDSTALPTRSQQRVKAIYEAGMNPKGWIVVHEAPKQLLATNQTNQNSNMKVISARTQQAIKKALKITGTVMGATALASGAVVLLAGAMLVILPALLISTAVLIDPILIAVTEDNVWIEIDRWNL